MADLFGTYDNRIKLTIDNAKIDSNQSWIPITVLLTSSQGEEVFTEFDADADFDRVAFTKSDESTELYADCEKFDDSAQVAVYHVSRDGWAVASGAATDFYMYYDNSASSNTTYISKSGGTAAQSVYDANFKVVYHKNDQQSLPDFYDTQYEATAEPDSDGWTLGGTDYSSVAAGILTIDTTGDATGQCHYTKTPDINFNDGVYYKIKVQIHSDTPVNGYLANQIYDGTQDERTILNIYDGQIKVRTSGGSYNSTAVTTTDAYHIYEVYVKGTVVLVYMDGVLKDTQAVESTSVTDTVRFGDVSGTSAFTLECMIDYIYYALGVTDNPVLTILDSTSNNNDGTKKGGIEPIEATGKVGQGQDFDGTDDYARSGSNPLDNQANITVETVLYGDNGAFSKDRAYFGRFDAGNEQVAFWYDIGEDVWAVAVQDTNSDQTHRYSSTTPAEETWTNVSFSYASGVVVLYENGVDVTGAGTESATANVKSVGGGMDIGTDYERHDFWDGKVDEVRVSTSIRAVAWIKATYNTLWDTLLTYGDEETSPAVDNVIFFGCNF